MKYKKVLIFITIILTGIQSNVYAQNPYTTKSTKNKKDTLFDIYKYQTIISTGDSTWIEHNVKKVPKKRTIFKAGKVYHYKAIYISSNNDTLSNSYVNMETTGLRRPDADSEKQDLVYYAFPNYKTDSIKLSNHFINTECQYWTNKNAQGVIENIENVWMHPIQSNQYKFTEVAPFPDVYFPVKKGNKWKNSTTIMKDWGEWNGQTVKCKYKISGKNFYLLGGLKIDCWVIKSVAKCLFGKSKLTTLFNEEYGFVKMEYKNYKNEKLIFILTNVEE